MVKKLIRYILNYLIACDQLLNSILLGHPDETLSSRLGRSIGKERYFWVKWFRISIDKMFFFDFKMIRFDDTPKLKRINHCEKSVMHLEQQNFRTVVDYEVWHWSKEK